MKRIRKMRRSKLVFISIVAMTLVSSLFMSCTKSSEKNEQVKSDDKLMVAFVSDQALDASEWLINLVSGVNEFQQQNSDVEIKMVEAKTANEYEPKIRSIAQAGYDVIITTYASTAEATIAVANDYPQIKFGSLDGTIDSISQYKNIEEFGLNRTETAYLAGVVAASESESNTVGIVGGMDEPVINAIIAGWQQGLVSVNPDIKDYVSYAGTWTDPTKGKDLGLALVDKGCDVIAAAAGGTGVGTAQAAAVRGVNFVAWDTHYPKVFAEKPLELGSALNYFDKLVIQFIEEVENGNFKPGQRVEYGMKEGVCAFDIEENARFLMLQKKL